MGKELEDERLEFLLSKRLCHSLARKFKCFSHEVGLYDGGAWTLA